MNAKALQALELHKVLEQLAAHCSFSAGAQLAREQVPTGDFDEAAQWQRETAEARVLLEQREVSLGGARDVRDPALLATRGIHCDPATLLDIRQTLRRATTLRRSIGRLRSQYPLLAELINEAQECSELQAAISVALTENGEIRDHASPRLAILRRDLKLAHERLITRLQRIVASSEHRPFLQEALVTTRGGRYVIPLKAGFKGRIPGIVHDSSASGATLFIEPLATVELNNAWRELQLEEEKEIRRILAALGAQVGEEAESIVRTVDVLAQLDLVLARARYAEQMAACEPIFVPFRPANGVPGSVMHVQGARHPLLGSPVVPIDLVFDASTWVLVITGPNTGGKTVCLKTAGLMALMAQCGLQLPADDARLSVFSGIYADIGDEQSIEQSLSTFSAHMTNTIDILAVADSRSLVLLDEVGAGTDPAEGSALARALLTHLRDRGVTTIVTTHHPELKIYGVETPGVRNASVEFDPETLKPTYRLVIGLPGRSNALAIAGRLGLDDGIIVAARHMVATEELVADDLLDEIQRTREDVRRQDRALRAALEDAEQQGDELQTRLDGLDDERRDVINAARRQAEGELRGFQRELRRLRRELHAAGQPLQELASLQEAAADLEGQVAPPPVSEILAPEADWVPREGQRVWLRTLNSEGTIRELDGDEALVQLGALRVRAGVHELRRRPQLEGPGMQRGGGRRYEASPDPVAPKGKSPGLELDLRGERVEEALKRFETWLDAAWTAGLPFGRIIHGKGTGALRKAVRDRAKDHPLIAKVTEAHPGEGGSGVTIIHMVPIT